MEPLVTALIPAFNAEHTIARALRSVVAQDYPALDILVVDDGSSDATAAIVERFGDLRIRLLSLPRNLGVAGATNAGVAAARGEYIAFLDADDEWLPGKIHKQVAVIADRPDITFVTCGCIFVRPNGEIVRVDDVEPPTGPETERWRSYLVASYVAKPSVLARRSSLDAVGPFDEQLPIAEDQDMWIRLGLAGVVGHVHEALVMAHNTPGSLTKRYTARQAEFILKMVNKHLEAQAWRLSPAERRQILAARHAAIGRNLYLSGIWWGGLHHLTVASILGHDPLGNAHYLLTANPAVRAIKGLFRRRPRVSATPPARPASAPSPDR